MRKACLADIAASHLVMTEDEYFAFRATFGAELKPLGKPCHDCAVVEGLYTEISDQLRQQPEAIKDAVSLRWFCHNHTNRACRGNIDRIASQPSQSQDSQGGDIG